MQPNTRALPPDDPQRRLTHDEVHARPAASLALPALVVCVAVLHEGITREQQWKHLQSLPGTPEGLGESMQEHFMSFAVPGGRMKWERHTEFTRYVLTQDLTPSANERSQDSGAPDERVAVWPTLTMVTQAWLQSIPGTTVAAIQLMLTHDELDNAQDAIQRAGRWLQGPSLVASLMGRTRSATAAMEAAVVSHSLVVTDFQMRDDGFERMVVLAPKSTTDTRAGRIAQRLIELEIYRLMALRGLPVAKTTSALLSASENELASLTAAIDQSSSDAPTLLHRLIALATQVEQTTAQHSYRFDASRAYAKLCDDRLTELRELAVPGTPTMGEFLRRRMAPAQATVDVAARRLSDLAQRIERSTALLRTRVDIAMATQNQELLAKLTRGQRLQLQLQSTVEGLSIAAISYYVVTLVLYGTKALKALGLALNPEMVAGLSTPFVLWAVWKAVRNIHHKVMRDHGD